MKLISLNSYGGIQGDIFFDFIKQEAKTADIFCLQEVPNASEENQNELSHGARIHLFAELSKTLENFNGVFHESFNDRDLEGPVDFNLPIGKAVFVKKDFKITGQEVFPILSEEEIHALKSTHNTSRSLQVVNVKTSSGDLAICNFHGVPFPGDKQDTETRLLQSQRIMDVLKNIQSPKILCGDFNLYPETQSVKMLEQGMVNLIKTFNIQNTRNEISWNKYGNKQYFADFTFVSPEVKVKSFEVPYNLVADHLPMVLEFEIQ